MRRYLSFFVLVLLWASPASGQVRFEILGARALGMGGAFVAVADDASAFHWNPAGTVKGHPVGMTFGWDDLHFGDPNQLPAPGLGSASNLVTSVIGSPLGVSYGYLKMARVVGVAGDGTSVVEALVVHHLGGTVSWSLLPGLVVGGTVKYLRGQPSIGASTASTAKGALDDALSRGGGTSSSKVDIDAGILGSWGPIRAGASFKNLLQPTFTGDHGFAMRLQRLIRIGVAVLPTDGLTLAFDMDLDTADPLVGLRRTVALGGETRLGVRVTLRAGVRWERGEAGRPIGALGGSVSIRPGLWLDGFVTRGRAGEHQGFGFALRAGS